ncbi:MAG: NAD(P)-dependent alcohol dehydrogenase [Planctomycetota bacterium]
MKAAVLYSDRNIKIENRPDPKPGPKDVLIRVKAVGVCGSDVHYFWSGGLGAHKVEQPIILGHECAGEVVALGGDVTEFRVGQRVVMEPGIPCRVCEYCRGGRYNICRKMEFMGTPPVDGAFCELVAWPIDFTFPVSDEIPFEEASLAEPLAVGVYAADMAEILAGQSAAVLGSSTIGLLTLQAALRAGIERSFISDMVPSRLDLAKKLGADFAINFKEQDVKRTILDNTNGRGVDVVFEAAGHPLSFKQTVELVRPGGMIILIGICQEDVIPFDFGAARRKEVTIKSVRRYCHVYPRAMRMLENGRFDVKSLITHEFPLDRVAEALTLVHHSGDGVLKAVVKP